MADAAQDRRERNRPRCSENQWLEFRGIVSVASQDRNGVDYTRLDIRFNESIDIKLFDPKKSIRERSIQSVKLSSLCEAIGLDFNDVPPCKGGWEEFVTEVCSLVNTKKYSMVYAKLTVGEAGWIELGEGRCFSTKPDLEYTDADVRYLDNVDVKSPGTAISDSPSDDGFNALEFDWKSSKVSTPKKAGKSPTEWKQPIEKFQEEHKSVFDLLLEKEAVILANPPEKDWLDELEDKKAHLKHAKIDRPTPNWAEEGHTTSKKESTWQDEKNNTNAVVGFLEPLGAGIVEVKPAWVEEAAKEHLEKKPERKKRASKKGVDLPPPIPEKGREGFDEIDLTDLPF